MNEDLQRVLSEAMKLDPEARVALVGSLLASLQPELEGDLEAAWAKEIALRLDDIRGGRVSPITWSAARRTLRGG